VEKTKRKAILPVLIQVNQNGRGERKLKIQKKTICYGAYNMPMLSHVMDIEKKSDDA
jgi:hypothetical protein